MAGILVRTDALLGLHDHITSIYDVHLAFHVLARGFDIWGPIEPTYLYRIHEDGLTTSTKLLMERHRWRCSLLIHEPLAVLNGGIGSLGRCILSAIKLFVGCIAGRSN